MAEGVVKVDILRHPSSVIDRGKSCIPTPEGELDSLRLAPQRVRCRARLPVKARDGMAACCPLHGPPAREYWRRNPGVGLNSLWKLRVDLWLGFACYIIGRKERERRVVVGVIGNLG